MSGVRETNFDRLVIFLGLALRTSLVALFIIFAAPVVIYLGITTFRCWNAASPLFEGAWALIAIWLFLFPGLVILALSVKGAMSRKTREIRWGEFGIVVLPAIAIFWFFF